MQIELLYAGEEELEKNLKGTAILSNKQFEDKMNSKIHRIEKDYFRDKLPLRQLAELCHSFNESVDKLNKKQKEILQDIVCKSILAKEFEINE